MRSNKANRNVKPPMSAKSYIALGLMSGTSLDGVDAAFIETDGEQIYSFGPKHFHSFQQTHLIKESIEAALKWRFDGPAPNILSQAEDYIDREHERAVSRICSQHPDWAKRMEVIGYHGQTILHVPPTKSETGRTLQLGQGRRLATIFNVPCVYDFRSADVAVGGQGAPLAPIYHEALCQMSFLTGRIAVVNIGGVSNVTFVEDGKPLRATDCGPGNGPLDSWMELRTGEALDKDGRLAWAGQVDHGLIEKWLRKRFFKRPIPRSADRYDFDVIRDMKSLSNEDGAATLAAFTAQAIASDVTPFDPQTVIICGGGGHNPAIMGMLRAHLSCSVKTAASVGWDGDALEAQAFGYLAVRALRGLPISFPGITGAPSPMTGGVVVRP